MFDRGGGHGQRRSARAAAAAGDGRCADRTSEAPRSQAFAGADPCAQRTTPGITIGTGEGGNAFGDRFFIRGFDARNDVFVDGIRDPAVSVRENFFTEQIEILKGPAATIDGRGTAGGAINFVTKQASELSRFL